MAKTINTPDLSSIFQALSTPYIVFAANDPEFTIIEENDAHAKIAMVDRSSTLNTPLLEAFPDTSTQYLEEGKSELLESIRKVIRTGQPDAMPRLNYDLKDQKGAMQKRYWSVTHYPIIDDSGNVVAVYQETKDITHEITIEDRLEKAEHQLDQVLASSLIGTWFWDIKKELVTTDTNLARMFGIDAEVASKGLPLKEFTDAIHQDDRSRVEASINEALQTGNAYEEEYRTHASNGNMHWVMARGYVEYDNAKEPESFTGVMIDISDRKKAEEAVGQSENRLKFMADSMPQLVWVTRPDGYHEYYNQQWYEYTGTKPGSTQGDGWNNLFHPDDQKRARELWQKSLATGEAYEIEYRLYHAKSKSYRWVIGRALPYRDESGEIVKWYGTCTDIDEQKRGAQIQTFLADLSKELSTSLDYHKMLKRVTELAIPTFADWCSVDLYDEEKGFEQVSISHSDPKKISEAKKYRELNPLELDQPTGIPNILRTGKTEFYPLINDELLEKYINDDEKLAYMKSFNLHSIIVAPLSIGDSVQGGITFISSDSGRYYSENDVVLAEEIGSRISLAITNSKLFTESQEDLAYRHKLQKELVTEKQKLESRVKERTEQLQLTNHGLREEIAKRRTIEKELKLNSEELARSNKELEDFAYVASHDLQEPLRKIQAFGDLLQSEYSEALGEGGAYVERMNAAAIRMSTLIQDLLAFSRVATTNNKLQNIDLNEIVDDVLIDLESRLEDVNGKVKRQDLPQVLADPTHMRQLFQNLISNGLKFHKSDVPPVITIKAKEVDSFIEFTIKDNGIGFDEKYLDRIFSVFQRLHGREKYEGTGIGLAVCRKIVERYGGSITAKSINHNGATFYIRLPKSKERV